MKLPAKKSAIVPTNSPPNFPVGRLAALLGLITVLLYWPALHNDFVNYDDGYYITENAHVQSGLTVENIMWAFSTPVIGNWHPVTILSHMLDCQLYGLNPWGHHLTSSLLHAINAMLVLLLFNRLTGAVWRSALVAALFAWHPLRVESVAWAAERKDVLSGCFGFLALLFYVRYAQQRNVEDQTTVERSKGATTFCRSTNYWLACFWFALGLMSKPMLVTWPFVLCLLDYWPLGRFQTGCRRAIVLEKIPFFALATAASIVTFVVQKQAGAVERLEILPVGMRVENALVSYCRYVGKTLWPTDLVVFYPHSDPWPSWQVLLAGIFLAGVTLLLWRNRQDRPFLLVGWLWFIGTLVPVIGLVQTGLQAMADRYTYIPSVGLLLLLVWGVHETTRHWKHQAAVLAVAGAMVVGLCAALTQRQIQYWKDSETLFQHALEITGENYVACYNLGNVLYNQGQTEKAARQFQTAIRFSPNSPEPYNGLGNALAKQGELDAAFRQFQEALRLNPDYAEAHNNLGNLLGRQGQTEAAIHQFQEAIRLKPDSAPAHYNLGNLFARTGQPDAAISQYHEALRINPHHAEAHNNLGNMLVVKGESAAAIQQFQEAIRLSPENADASYNLGNCFLKKGQLDEAISQLQMAVRFKPDFAPAHYYLGIALGGRGRIDDAISQFEEAVRLKPDYTKAREKLAHALEMKKTPAGN